MYTHKSIKGALAFLAASLCLPTLSHAESYAVIVNTENNFSTDVAGAKQQVKRLYLKEQTSWPANGDALPFARAQGTPEQDAFTAGVLGMTQEELNSHWLSLKQTRGETPPREVGSSRIVERLVGKSPGGFTVVKSSEAAAMSGVKVLFEFQH